MSDPKQSTDWAEQLDALEPEISLLLTGAEVQLVRGALGICQHDLVADLVRKIEDQAVPQMEALGQREALKAVPVEGCKPS